MNNIFCTHCLALLFALPSAVGFSGKPIVSSSPLAVLTDTLSATPVEDLDTEMSDTLFQSLPEVMVTAFNTSRRLLDAPGSVSMIGFSLIERESPVTLLPMLNHTSGVFAHSGTLNTSRITIRGIGARVPYATGKIRAYFNNIPLTNGSGISIVEHIDPGVVERIELTKGPASSAYGAGLGGTINITARKPSLRHNGVSGSFEAGSFGLMRNGLTLDTELKELDISLSYNRVRSDGFRENNTYRRDVLTSVVQWEPSATTVITGLLAISDMKGSIPSSIDSVLFVTNPRAAAANWKNTAGYEDVELLLAGVSGTHWLSEQLSIDMSLFTTIHQEHEMRPFDVLYEDRHSGGTRLKTNYFITHGQVAWHLMAGGELFLETFNYKNYENIGGIGVQGSLVSDNKDNISHMNVFAQSDMEFSRLNLSLGLNLNSSKTDYQDLFMADQIDRSAKYNPGMILSPRLGANIRILPDHAVFFSASHGFSPVSLSETLTPDGFVNLDIMPETSWSFEAGMRGNFLKNRVYYDLSLFQMYVTNLLVAERIGPDAWVGRNAGASKHQGVEAEMHIYLVRNIEKRTNTTPWWQLSEVSVQPVFTFSNFRFTDFMDYGIDYSGNQIPGIPAYVVSSSAYVQMVAGLYMNAQYRFVGEMAMNDLNNRYSDAYQLFNLMLGYKANLTKWELDVYVAINNIFDEHYASMILVNAPSFGSAAPRYYYPGMPRNIRSGFRVTYNF
jgi:iron complex outermembrane recepter protein